MDIKKQLTQWIQGLKLEDSALESWYIFCQEYQKNSENYLRELVTAHRQRDVFMNVLRAINSQRNIQEVLGIIIDGAISLMEAERGFILFQDITIARHFDNEDIVGEYKISQKIAQQVQSSRTPIVTDNARHDQRFSPFTSVFEHRLKSIICCPLVVNQNDLGVIYLDNRMIHSNFDENDLKLLSVFADHASIAIANAYLLKKNQIQMQQIKELNARLNSRNTQLSSQLKSQSEELEFMRKTIFDLTNNKQYYNIYANSPQMEDRVFRLIEKVKDNDIPVLIQGESGTGKELIARAIHDAGCRKNHRFVSENCAAIPESLFESELFGHEKGAFTGANSVKKGLFEEAYGGTLFLDEVGELPMSVQTKLLRALAEKSIRRLGGSQMIPVDVRIIAATNRDLWDMVKNAEFREDLFYRLKVITINPPPLRERREDIPLLVEVFLQEIAKISKSSVKKIDGPVLEKLIAYDWPGNVRQLRNEVHRLATLSGAVIEVQNLSPEVLGEISSEDDGKIRNLPAMVRDMEKTEITRALKVYDQNKSKAAQFLGLTRFALQRKIEKYNL